MLKPADKEALRERLHLLYAPIEADLDRANRIFTGELASKFDFVKSLTARVRRYQGKRLRPALLLLCGKATGRVGPQHHAMAAVVEMIHTASLVHDDVLDGADRRRHVGTVNAEWGAEASVLLGDFLFSHAFYLATNAGTKVACQAIGRATHVLCESELRQIVRRGAFELSESEYLEIITGKTAELVACACWLGAYAAEAPPRVADALQRYGRDVGVAFQITDDLLDVVASEDAVGKSLGTDLLKQKPTLPLIRFRETADPEALAAVRRLFENPDIGNRERLAGVLAEHGAIDYARARAREFAESAAERLAVLEPSPARDSLEAVAQFVLDRGA